MRTIGLIGGMSWNSTAEYYRIINEMVVERLGGLHSARLIIYSLDFDEVRQAQRQARWDDATAILTQAGIALKKAGVDFLLIGTNTMHKVAAAVREKVGLPLLDIIDVTANAIIQSGHSTVGLLGSRFVMEESFYREKMEKQFGIKLLVPKEEDQAIVDRIIFDELCKGKVEASSHRDCVRIIAKLARQGAQGIILGCTELPLLIHAVDINVPIFDTTRLHAEAAVNRALASDGEDAIPYSSGRDHDSSV
jgi:aspartate racemase